MSNPELLPMLLHRINENQLALEAAIMELTKWIEQRGSIDVGRNVRGVLEVIEYNSKYIDSAIKIYAQHKEF